MTIDEAIRILNPETRRAAMREVHVFERIDTDQEACRLAVAALRAQKERENQEPLTLDELRKMGGEPVWIVPLCSDAGWTAQWRIYTVRETVTVKSKSYGWYFMYPKDYGKTWMAYRNKLEEDHK